MILVANPQQLLNGNNLSNIATHELYMGYALQLAIQALAFDEVPVGSIVVCNQSGNIVGMGHNQTFTYKQVNMHAEMNAIKHACQYFNNYRLPNCRIYITLEPCAMCAGAILHARFTDLIFGAFDSKTGMAGSIINIFNLNINHQTKITSGILETESSQLLQNFFKQKRFQKKLNLNNNYKTT